MNVFFRNRGQISLGQIIFIFVIVAIGLWLGKNVVNMAPTSTLFITLGVLVAGLTLVNTNIGLFIIIFAMLLSPEIKVGEIPGRDIVIRLEDLLLILVTFSWLVKVAITKQIIFFRNIPLNRPIIIYGTVCLILTLRGILLEYVSPAPGFFYLLKYVEYFLLYFMVLNQIQTKRQIKIFTIALLITCAITVLYANLQIGSMARIAAPFEGEKGEPNTLGGYLTFMFAIIMGILLYSTSKNNKLYLMLLALSIIPAVLFTLSRTSYIAFIPMWIGLIIFGPKKLMLTSILLIAIVFGSIFMPQIVKERIESTLSRDTQAGTRVRALDPSSAARIGAWREVWRRVKERPIFGYGVTGIGFFVDGQYMLVLGELGLVGFLVFLFLLQYLFRFAMRIFIKVKDNFAKGLSLGFLAGVIAVIVFNIGANGFIITRIMEPFWFVAAMVTRLPQLQDDEA